MIPTHNTSAAERIASEPKAPWVATEEQIGDYSKDYLNANLDNLPVLKYHPHVVNGLLVPPPVRQGPGAFPQALFAEIKLAEDNIRSALGMFQSDVGEQGPERTGQAISNRQKPGDIGTFCFADNLARGMTHSYQVIDSMMPQVYDTARDVRLRSVDETEHIMPINTSVKAALESIRKNGSKYKNVNLRALQKIYRERGDVPFNDISIGKYSVAITVGPSYATQRSEAVTQLGILTQAMPREMALGKDILVRNMDFLGADELAERFRKTLPPGLVKPREGDEPARPSPPPPQVQLMMQKVQLEQVKVAAAKEKAQLERAKIEVEKLKLINEMRKSKEGVKKEVLDIMNNLTLPTGEHPADKFAAIGDEDEE